MEKLLEGCKERGYLKVRGRQRTDSTHVLGALRVLSKWERTAETMRAALNALASATPEWLTEHADPEWFERYGRRIEDQRLPKGKEARTGYLRTVGADGMRLLEQLDAPYTPQVLKELSEVEILRQIWEQYYEQIDGEIRVLDPKEMPEGARRIESPYEVEARYSTKRSMGWVGYKVHLTESCDEGFPHLITDVHTTAATATDVKQLSAIQDGLAAKRALTRRATGGLFLRLWEQPRFEPRSPRDRPHRPSLQGQHLAGQSRRRLRRGELPHRLGKEDGKLSSGAPEHPLVGNQDRSGAKYDPHRLLRRRLQRMPESIFVHASQGSPTHPHPAATRRARGHPVRQKAPEDRRVRRPLLPEGRHRRDGLTRSKSLRVAPSSLPGPEEDPPPGAGHCDRC